MSSRTRLFWAVFLGAALLFVTTGAFAAVQVWKAGLIVVSVDPKNGDDPKISLQVPAIVVPAALALVPDEALRNAEPGLRTAIPLALKACELLEAQGDAVFVDVVNRHERVSVAKVGDDVLIDVVTDDEEIHVAVPISSFRTVVTRIDRALFADGERV